MSKKYGIQMSKKYGIQTSKKYGIQTWKKYGIQTSKKYGIQTSKKYGIQMSNDGTNSWRAACCERRLASFHMHDVTQRSLPKHISDAMLRHVAETCFHATQIKARFPNKKHATHTHTHTHTMHMKARSTCAPTVGDVDWSFVVAEQHCACWRPRREQVVGANGLMSSCFFFSCVWSLCFCGSAHKFVWQWSCVCV